MKAVRRERKPVGILKKKKRKERTGSQYCGNAGFKFTIFASQGLGFHVSTTVQSEFQ